MKMVPNERVGYLMKLTAHAAIHSQLCIQLSAHAYADHTQTAHFHQGDAQPLMMVRLEEFLHIASEH